MLKQVISDRNLVPLFRINRQGDRVTFILCLPKTGRSSMLSPASMFPARVILPMMMFMVTALLIGVAGGSAVLITDLVRKGMVFAVLGGATDVIGDFIR